jgi:fatty acyl-CoA reductase
VEKILRVQPDVRKIYLLVRAIDADSAKQRVEAEVLINSNLHCLNL